MNQRNSKRLNDNIDIVDRLEYLIEDTTVLRVYSSQINKDLIDAKDEIVSLRKQIPIHASLL